MRQRDIQTIHPDVLATIDSSRTKITPFALKKRIFDRHGLNKKQIKSVIKDLVSSGELTYTYEFGNTYLERSFAKPVRISKHIVLIPPGCYLQAEPEDIVVQIKPGASFGAGRHPSTRLAVKAIEFVLLGHPPIERQKFKTVLDVGTGSGVLVLTAVLGGVARGLGIDIDSCARVEAAENVKINGVEDKVIISEKEIETVDERFLMVLANLRYPSLCKLSDKLSEVTDPEGILILSGIKSCEVEDLLTSYSKNRFKCVWKLDELGWAGLG